MLASIDAVKAKTLFANVRIVTYSRHQQSLFSSSMLTFIYCMLLAKSQNRIMGNIFHVIQFCQDVRLHVGSFFGTCPPVCCGSLHCAGELFIGRNVLKRKALLFLRLSFLVNGCGAVDGRGVGVLTSWCLGASCVVFVGSSSLRFSFASCCE